MKASPGEGASTIPRIEDDWQKSQTQCAALAQSKLSDKDSLVLLRHRMACPTCKPLPSIDQDGAIILCIFQIHCQLANKHASKIRPSLMDLKSVKSS